MRFTTEIRDALEQAVRLFSESEPYQKLVSGNFSRDELREFLANVFRTHYMSSHIIALLFAALPSEASESLKENLLEEMGLSQHGKAHAALLRELVAGAGFADEDVEALIRESREQIRLFCAQTIPFPSLRDLCLSLLLETMSFELLLSKCSGGIARALDQHYSVPKQSAQWFALHSEVDIRHAEEGFRVIQEYLEFHRIGEPLLEKILQATFRENPFLKRYFPGK